MKKVLFFLLFLSTSMASSVIAQPIFVVSSVDTEYIKEGEVIIYGGLKNAEDCGIIFSDEAAIDYNQLHILYKNKIISIFPENILSLSDFFYDQKNSYPPKQSYHNPTDLSQFPEPSIIFDDALEDPPITFDYISEAIVYCRDKKTSRVKQGVMVDGNIIIEYRHRTKTMTLNFSNLKIDW